MAQCRRPLREDLLAWHRDWPAADSGEAAADEDEPPAGRVRQLATQVGSAALLECDSGSGTANGGVVKRAPGGKVASLRPRGRWTGGL